MKIRNAFCLVLLLVLSSFTDPGKMNYRKVDDGVVVQLQNTAAGAAMWYWSGKTVLPSWISISSLLSQSNIQAKQNL